MEYLERIKLLLGVGEDSDDLLSEIVNLTKEKIISYINSQEVPQELEWILIELCIKRYNRIGSEGMSSENVDGSSITYEEDELANYTVYLEKYIAKNTSNQANKKGWCLL